MKKLNLCLLATISFINTYAQKLPEKQQASLRAPAGIKIDGNPDDWGNKFQAYNNATDVYYSIANDDKNLYLVIKATGKFIIDGRILAAGISFTVNHNLSKKDAAAITVTYPVGKGEDWGRVRDLFYGVAGLNGETNAGGDNSLIRLNKTFTEQAKFISIAGIKGIDKNEVPVYNDLNIRAASAFHAPAVYVYELAIPLALMKFPEGGTNAFSYHIKLNVPKAMEEFFSKTQSVPAGSNLPPPPPPAPQYVSSTDFWGEYTLAK